MIIFVKGTEYELPLNGLDIQWTKTIDSTFDSAYIETPPLEVDAVEGLDLSRRLPRLAEVRFEHQGITYQMMIAESQVEKARFGVAKYVHKLDLVSFTKDLTGYPMENITLTQPKGDMGEFIHSVNILDPAYMETESDTNNDYYDGGKVLIPSASSFLAPLVNNISTNPSAINGLTITDLTEYNMTLNVSLYNIYHEVGNSVTFKIRYGANIIKEKTITLEQATLRLTKIIPFKVEETINFKYLPTLSDSLTVEVVIANTEHYAELINLIEMIHISKVDLLITSYTTFERPYRTYAQLAEKMLRKTPYTLSDNARARLNILAPEGKYEGYTVYDGLSKIASENAALVTVKRMISKRVILPTNQATYDEATEKFNVYVGESIYDKSPYDYNVGTCFRQLYNPSVLRWVATGTLTEEVGNVTPGTECFIVGELSASKINIGGAIYFQELECQEVLSESYEYRYYQVVSTEQYVREVDFLFFDNPRVIEPPHVSDVTIIGELEDYVNAVQLNTKNVVEKRRHSPHIGGWGLLSSGSIERITTSNIAYFLEEPLEKVVRVLVKGFASQSTNFTWTTSDVTDITDQVVDELYYNTLPSDSDYSYNGKQVYQKNNCLYVRKGDRIINGMSFTGEHQSTLIGQPNVTRALYEAILAKRTKEVGELVTRTGNQAYDDPGLDGDVAIQIYVEYQSLGETHARVYKDDQTGFERQRVKYMNESSNINDSQAIGGYAQVMVNRMGGTKYKIEGWANTLDEAPQVGDVDSSGKVFTIVSYQLGKIVKYTAICVQDYNVISSYIGINSRHRIEEVASSDTTNRVLRYTSKVIFKPTQASYTTRLSNENRLMRVLSGETQTPVSYGYMECHHSNGNNVKLHLSFDVSAKGKTIEAKFALKDNYSAGFRRYSKIISSQTVYFNREVAYTDYYGKVDHVNINGYMGYNAFSDSEREAYPEATADKGINPLFEIEDIIDKDAREIISGLVEIPILSEHPNVVIYNGFAEYNAVVDNTSNIARAILMYVPPKNAIKVDLAKIKAQTMTVQTATVGTVAIQVTPSEACRGIVWYDKNSLDLVMAYVDDLSASLQDITLYYEVQDD